MRLIKLFLLVAMSGCVANGVPEQNQHSLMPQGSWQVKKGSVYDGDTFRAINQTTKEEIKVRLSCIDAPEKKQDLGIASRDYLRSLLNKGDSVILEKIDQDRYGCIVAIAFVPTPKGELAVNGEMVKSGMAYFYRKYAKNCPQSEVYEAAERQARSKKVGVWKYNSVKPWDYRKVRR